jgi:pimeloyl-ACP methyl ester carboxylesterase
MQSSYFLLNDLRFHYLHWNLGDAGQPVLLLHGLASNARIWELVAPELAAAGMVPLAPDLRGHGLSDKPGGDYGFDTFRRDLLAFIDAAYLERPVLVGHSWGALLAIDYAAQFPRGPRAPRAIVLVDGGVAELAGHPGASWESVSARLAPPRLAGLLQDDFLARLSEWTRHWDPGERAIQIILSNFEVAADETIWPRLTYERHMQILRAIWEFKTYARLPMIGCPALAVLAIPPEPHFPTEAEDLELKQRAARRAQEILPHLQVEWMPGTIHDIPLHRPQQLAEHITAFVSRLQV